MFLLMRHTSDKNMPVFENTLNVDRFHGDKVSMVHHKDGRSFWLALDGACTGQMVKGFSFHVSTFDVLLKLPKQLDFIFGLIDCHEKNDRHKFKSTAAYYSIRSLECIFHGYFARNRMGEIDAEPFAQLWKCIQILSTIQEARLTSTTSRSLMTGSPKS